MCAVVKTVLHVFVSPSLPRVEPAVAWSRNSSCCSGKFAGLETHLGGFASGMVSAKSVQSCFRTANI